jgi:flagellar basal-body rod protein FlgC
MEVSNTFGPVDIAISGLRAQNKQIEVISSNVANARTTDVGNGQPYRRLEAVFEAEDSGISGVSLGEILTDMSDFHRIFDPSNPKADKYGYVAMPNVNLPIEMMNLNIATRAYKANAAILKRYQEMVETTLELLR